MRAHAALLTARRRFDAYRGACAPNPPAASATWWSPGGPGGDGCRGRAPRRRCQAGLDIASEGSREGVGLRRRPAGQPGAERGGPGVGRLRRGTRGRRSARGRGDGPCRAAAGRLHGVSHAPSGAPEGRRRSRRSRSRTCRRKAPLRATLGAARDRAPGRDHRRQQRREPRREDGLGGRRQVLERPPAVAGQDAPLLRQPMVAVHRRAGRESVLVFQQQHAPGTVEHDQADTRPFLLRHRTPRPPQ